MQITTLQALRQLHGPAGERSLKKEMPSLDKHATRFIELSPFVVLATSDADGHMDASPRGGEAGFVKVLDAKTVLSTDPADLALCVDARRTPKLVIRVTVDSVYLHCAKALMRSQLWDASRHPERSKLPDMGEMLRDQIQAFKGETIEIETQADMVQRFQQSL